MVTIIATFQRVSSSNVYRQEASGANASLQSVAGGPTSVSENRTPQTEQELKEERRKIRRLQVLMNMVMSEISMDPDMTLDEAHELAAGVKRAALAMFPDKELAYDILYEPRLQRLMSERFRP